MQARLCQAVPSRLHCPRREVPHVLRAGLRQARIVVPPAPGWVDNRRAQKAAASEPCRSRPSSWNCSEITSPRHSAGTLLGEQHVDIHVIQRILGHAHVTTTRIYTQPTDPPTREAAGLIGKALWPDASQLQPELQAEAGS